MSAPASRSRGSTRSRGSIRGNSRLRATRNAANGPRSGSSAPPGGTNEGSNRPQLKTAARSSQSRGRGVKRAAPPRPHGVGGHSRSPSHVEMEPWRVSVTDYNASYKTKMNDLYQTLKTNRDIERKQAIQDGFLADPDKPTSLANAITPIGTCEDMCPQFERVERIVQLMVDSNEKENAPSGSRVPCEALMVKRFRRSAAGYDEQLPSDIRPPATLKRTLDYLVNHVVDGAQSLSTVHKFVWDRTRGIRNDFSIQQVTRTEDLRIAIDCFERIARFHILSLHQLSRTDLKDNEFDHHQEREQLNNTLLSLMYYYDDSRQKLASPNEAEFRAYCIIFEIQDQRPDLEDRMQSWPGSILRDMRVRTALKLYAAAGNISDEQGPLRPRTSFPLAQSNSGGFWSMIQSNATSYLMACVAEIYFNHVRGSTLEIIWNAYKGKRGGSSKVGDWTIKDMTYSLGFDDNAQTAQFCEEHDFTIAEGEDNEPFLDLSSVAGGHIGDSNPRRKQIFSRSLVEAKRLGRRLSAVIDGLSASEAQAQGFVDDLSDAEYASETNEESLFLDDEIDNKAKHQISASDHQLADVSSAFTNGDSNPFNTNTGFGTSSLTNKPLNSEEGKPDQSGPNSAPQKHDPQSTFFNPFPSAKPATSNPFLKPPTAQTNGNGVDTLSGTPRLGTDSGSSTWNPFAVKSASSSLAQAESKQENTRDDAATTRESSFPQLPFQTTTNPVTGEATTQEAAPKMTGPTTFPWSTQATDSPGWMQVATKADDHHTNQSTKPDQLPSQTTLSATFPTTQPTDNRSNSTTTASKQGSLLFSGFTKPATDTMKSSKEGPEIASSLGSEPFKSPSPWFSSNKKIDFSTTHKAPAPSDLFKQVLPGGSNAAGLGPPSTETRFSSATPSNPSVQAAVNKATIFPSAQGVQTQADSQAKVISTQARSTSTKSQLPDPRPRALDQLAETLMNEQSGLLQQFVEYTIGPIIQSALSKHSDEKSWVRARKYRTILLAKKYFTRWKRISWNLGLQRRARERRVNLAQSVREVAVQSTASNRVGPKAVSPTKVTQEAKQVSLPQTPAPMPPPSTMVPSKRQSLSSRLIEEGRSLLKSMNLAGSKRKRSEDEVRPAEGQSSVFRPQHKRSNTLMASTSSPSAHRKVNNVSRHSIDSSRVGDGSLLGHTLLKQAHRLAEGPKLDTTRTDYFTLKAMGVDPDTPIVPKVTKRIRPASENMNMSTSKTRRQLDPASGTPDSGPEVETSRTDDEALFASIRAVRQTLAESATWFQNERQSLERSVTPNTNASPQKQETPAERRLCEIRERGHVPTRTELRHRAMSDKAWLSNGFGDHAERQQGSTLDSPSAGNTTDQATSQNKKIGFAALSQQPHINGFASGTRESSRSSASKGGESIDDAIEL